MSKICSKCKKENPSSANFCMYCQAQLIAEEELTSEDKLQKELNEAKETISLQRERLSTLDKQLKQYENKSVLTQQQQSQIIEERKKHEQQIAEKEKLNANLNKQLEEIKNRKSKNRWTWFFFLLCILLLFLILGMMTKYYSAIENRNGIVYKHQDEIKQLKNENNDLADLKVDRETFNKIKHENEKLRDENKNLISQITQLKENKPVTTNNIKDDNFSVQPTNRYRAITKAYFYDFKNGQFIQRNAYIVANDAVEISHQISGYGYTKYGTTEGYLKMSDLTKN